jgi:hypothetical protein
MRSELVIDALEMAVWRRRPVAGLLVHHSDRGVQYTAISFGKRLEEVGIAFPRWEGPEPLRTTLWQRAYSHLEDRTPRASTPLSRSRGSEEHHL